MNLFYKAIIFLFFLFTKPILYCQVSNDDNEIRYRVVAYSHENNFIISESNTTLIKKFEFLSLYIPNAFTPDGDGINDLFFAKGINISEFNIQIYNRWGEKIFESDDMTEVWDGTYNNLPVPQGSYVYSVFAHDNNSNEYITKKGNVTLIR